MSMFRKAEKQKAKLRLGITGPAGAGKTYSSLLIAFGIGGRIALIDTENGSGDLYSSLGDYDICSINSPYSVQKYIDAINAAQNENYDVVIIDSLSHAWAGEGGLLDLQGKIAANSKSGNSYTAWREVTPLHNRLIDTILSSDCHIIATMRSKTEYLQTENDFGRKEIRKVGTAPVQRDGMDYEFGIVFDLNINHSVSVSKDRTGIFDGQVFTISKQTGEILRNWLNQGYDPNRIKDIFSRYLAVCGGQKNHAINAIKLIIGDTPSNSLSDDQFFALENDLQKRELINNNEVQNDILPCDNENSSVDEEVTQ